MIWTEQFMKWKEHEPQVRHTAGRVVEIKFDLTHNIVKTQETVTYSIATQHRDHDRINDDILMETEEYYNKVSTTMFKFHESIFSENHKSYYNETDLKALDECRTIVPNGRLLKAKNYDSKGYELVLAPEDMCSIDTRKAYSYQATKITVHTFQCSKILMYGNYTPKKMILTNSITTPCS